MTSKHTPGPWNIAPKTATYKLAVPDDVAAKLKAAGIQIEFQALSVGTAEFGSAAIIPLDESNIENARLIAAAPELLVLVERMLKDGQFFLSAVEAIDPHTSDFELWANDARSAISKAAGETS